MEQSERIYLTGSILLSDREDGGSPREYTVGSVIGTGGSSVCYEARTVQNGAVKTGKLKEFYPVDSLSGSQAWYYSLGRLPNGQLVPEAGTIRKFDEMCAEYIEAYRLLWKVIGDDPKNEVLKGYIQQGEILYGCPAETDGRRPTVYIWSPGVAGKGFDDYLAEMRKNPAKDAENRLSAILNVVDSVTDCVKALHTAGLLHMDIKPSNFLVQYDSDFHIIPDRISLFDINTLCSVDSKYLRPSGTEGFCAPEVREKGKADNRSDIYSLGALLFNALVITRDIPDGLYRDFFYPSISQLVKHSSLFLSSEVNSDAALMGRLCRILEKCLARDPRKRYQSCTELKKDLKAAGQRLKKLMNSGASAKKSEAGLTDSTIVIQKLLHEHPLYSVRPDAKEIHALVVGCDIYGQRFLDVALQCGQMWDTHLNIAVLSETAEQDCKDYTYLRPALGEFVNINGSLKGREATAYATVNFCDISEIQDGGNPLTFHVKMPENNREIVRSILLRAMQTETKYDYIFVSLNDDRLNKSVAVQISEELEHGCPVCYVSFTGGKPRKADIQNRLYPVCVNEPIDIASPSNPLGEMSFNTHRSWSSTVNMDLTKERRLFFESDAEEDRYNRESSIASALSIQYKLHSIQIDCDDPLRAAAQFSAQILDARSSDSEAEAKFDRLVELEHRRWVIERAVDGWTAPRDENGSLRLRDCIARGSVKDRQKRTHPCMVRSSASSPLNDPKYAENRHRLWNEGEIDPALDELDRMSIELHRCFRAEAEQLRQIDLYQNSDLQSIQSLIPSGHTDAGRAFRQFRFALKNILNGVESYSRQYDHYENAFRQTLGELPPESKAKMEDRLALVRHAFFPVIESNLYRDYKANDETLIRNIPFILSYRYRPSIAIPFEDGRRQNDRNEAVFGSVAAATVLRPTTVRFLYCFDRASRAELLSRKLDAVLNYFRNRDIHCGIELAIAVLPEASDAECDLLQAELQSSQEAGSASRFRSEPILYYADDYADAAMFFADYLKEHPADLYDGTNPLFLSAYENAEFLRRVEALKLPYFEFDWRNKRFTTVIGCEYLRYVQDDSFLRVHDMFALMNAQDNRYNLPEFADDYEALWRIYSGQAYKKSFENGVGNWNRLCMCLEKYEKDRKPLARIILSTEETPAFKILTYFLPAYTFAAANALLEKLREHGIAEPDSSLTFHASDTCRLRLKVNSAYEQAMSAVFADPQQLLYGMDVKRFKSFSADYVTIQSNDPVVTNLNLDADGAGRHTFSLEVLQQLEKRNFITRFTQNEADPCFVSFTYSSPRIKQLLTTAGEILEIYAYYDILKTGYFDDAACGYEFTWEAGGVTNELDLVLTKGFKSIIIECKAVVSLTLDYYHKLHSIADQFGIGTTKILLGNTYSNSAAANANNAMQMSRGSQLNIQTISGKDQIINIGQTLKEIMENS